MHLPAARASALSIGVALLIGAGTSGASASTLTPPPTKPPTAPALPLTHLGVLAAPPEAPEPALDAALLRAEGLPPATGAPELAAALFPGDLARQNDAIPRLEQVAATLSAASVEAAGPSALQTPQAVPGVVLAALPVIARCTAAALGASGLGVIRNFIANGDWPSAKEFAVEAIAGCLGPFVPWPWLKRKVAYAIAGTVLWIIVNINS